MKGNQPELLQAVTLWLQHEIRQGDQPDVTETNKGHGRLEKRELWIVESQELGAYLEQEYGWPGLRWSGRVKRRRRKLRQQEWQEEEVVWIAGGAWPGLSGEQALQALRGHWEIENRVFWVRDVSGNEDRLHGRAIGFGLSVLRSIAVNIVRACGYLYIPDGWRAMAACADRGLALLTHC